MLDSYMTITFLFPHPTSGPTGGYKVVYEYANRLVADGHEVHIVYSGSIYWSRKTPWHKFTCCVRWVERKVKGYSCRGWFPLDHRVREHFTLSLCERHVPVADVYVATSPYTAWYLNRYATDARKFYFIQGYEDWGPGLRAILHDTYHYQMQKIVVATWLQRMLKEEYGEDSVFVPNGFDFGKFRITVPVTEKNRQHVSMLYHDMLGKDCAMGLRALTRVKEHYPQLRATLFGVPVRPDGLPEWIDYYQCPDDELHLRINNEAAIYIGTSRTEGWGLTVGEAMMCGQAVCCTDNPGYREMATNGETALVTPVGDSEALARSMERLIADDAFRCRIAENGHNFIQHFTWEDSYRKFKTTLGL